MKHRFRHFFNDIKFRQKLLLTYMCISIIPTSCLGMFCYNQTKALLVEREQNNTKDYLTQATMSLNNQIEIYDNLSDYIAYNQTIAQVIGYQYDTYYEMYEQYTTVLDPMLASLKYFHSDVNKVTIYTKNNIVKHDTTIASIDEIEKTSWYQRVKEEPGREISWFVDANKKKAFSARNMPLLENKANKGVLYINVDYNSLFEGYCQMSGSNYGIYILDEEGNFVFQYAEMEDSYKEMQLTKEQFSRYCTSVTEDSQTLENYTFAKTTTKNNWTVWLYRPDAVIDDSIWTFVPMILFATLSCVAISFIVAATISKLMVSGIEKLTKNMSQVEKGNMDIIVTSDGKDEVGELIRGFGKMLTRINHLIEEVYKGRIAQKEYEMKALQSQINPHFLYNSLSVINWKAIEAEQTEISRITLLLSKFYRTALNRGKNILSIRDEINNMKSYLDIQLIMHDNSFDVEIKVEEEIMEYATLNLILQPLVENAIDHGIDLKENGRGKLTITGSFVDGDIYIKVIDDGIGMEQEKVNSILTKSSKGYGVRNVHDRIQLLFGKEYGLKVESERDKGTEITIKMPATKM